MKKIILLALALAALMMVGRNTNNTKIIESKTVSDYYGINVIEIDSCEYIISHVNSGQIIIHKQNCRFCKERRQKELKELVIKLKKK